ncbi:MAG TPA: histone H1 [Verrucomicrobiae bacterium]|nr:histone H1 [Verrucomicrobiae bacterium]
MPKRTSKKKKAKKKRNPEEDVNQLAYRLVHESTAEPPALSPTKEEISRFMQEMGRKGGKIGGKRRLETMTPEERSRVALKAAQSRWKKHQKATQPS